MRSILRRSSVLQRECDITQTAALIEALRGSRMLIPVLFAALCGLRRGEITALGPRIDLSTGQVSVVESAEQSRTGVRYKPPKSGKGRTVALPASALIAVSNFVGVCAGRSARFLRRRIGST